MNRADLVDALAEKLEISKKQAGDTIATLFDPEWGIIVQAMKTESGLALVGFGTLGSKSRPARTARNPITGDPVAVPATQAPFFKAGKTLKDTLNRKK